MPTKTFTHVLTLRKQIGDWAYVRMLRNKGFTFEFAYYAMFGCQPKHK